LYCAFLIFGAICLEYKALMIISAESKVKLWLCRAVAAI